MPPNASRTIFVANIPFDVSEEQLAGVFSEAGPVNSVEIKFDPQTGRSKGYAFVQFYDDATALSAVRNLQDVPVNGRNLRVEASTDEPGPRRRGPGGAGGAGGGGGRGGHGGAGAGAGGGYGRRDNSPPRDHRQDGGYRREEPPYPPAGLGAGPGPGGQAQDVNINLLPPGQELQPGQKATDAISKTLAAISPGQMYEVMSSMKTLVSTNPDEARRLLSTKPQLAYALFQAMLLMNIVDPSVLQRIQPLPPTSAPQPSYPPSQPAYPAYPPASAPSAPPAPPAALPGYPPYPPTNSYRPPQSGGYGVPPQAGYNPAPPAGYGAPPPAPAPAPAPAAQGFAALPASAQAALATLPEDQRAMLVQVLQLTPDQVNALDPQQKASIVQLRQQFLGTA